MDKGAGDGRLGDVSVEMALILEDNIQDWRKKFSRETFRLVFFLPQRSL